MLNAIKKIFTPKWKHKVNLIIKNKIIREEIYDKGFTIVGKIDLNKINKLKDLYAKTHDFDQNEEGGMFYSVYSQDLDYRKKINEEIKQLLESDYNDLFVDFKTIINSFIIKLPGVNSEFYLHQDSTGLDENKYSPLSAWIPLQDVTVDNGCLFFVPKSHQFASPYRSISFKQPFDDIKEEVLSYAVPIEMKAGEILIFDNRILHNSSANLGKEPRLVVMSGIFPKEAKILSVYKDVDVKNSPLEIYEQDEDFLIKNKNFYIDCVLRPKIGVQVKEVPFDVETWTKNDFQKMCKNLDIQKVNLFKGKKENINCHIIAEPNVD